jgi:hypothetical protein
MWGRRVTTSLPTVRLVPIEEASEMTDRYEIRVSGHLDARWAAWFDGFSLTRDGDGTTVLAGRTDQAGLHGVLRTLADLGLPLVSVTPTDAS